MTGVIQAHLPVFVVITPLFVSFLLSPMARRFGWVQALVVGAEAAVFLLALRLGGTMLGAKTTPFVYNMGGWPAPWGIQLSIGYLSALFLLIVSGVMLPVSLFAVDNLHEEVGGVQRSTRFFVLFLLLSGALSGMAVTNDLFNVFVLVEVATLSCCGLVSAGRGPKAAEAAFNYLILATLGSGLLLGGIGFIYIITGNLNMGFAAEALSQNWMEYPHVVWMAMSFFLIGFGVKAALFPLHIWLPDAHSSAPSPGSAILSGLAVKGYIICFMKVLFSVFGVSLLQVFRLDGILVFMGALAILAGSLLAIAEDGLKRRLAYSTVAQIGYVVLGMGLLTNDGLTGTLFYMGSHGFIKSALFLAAGSIIHSTGKTKVSELAGVGRRMPITMGVFTIGSLALVGIPLLSGFVGKWYMLRGCLEAGLYLPALVIIAGSVLCAGYLFPIVRIAYFEKAVDGDESLDPSNGAANWRDPGIFQRAGLLILALAIVLLGVMPEPFLELASRAANSLLVIK